MLISNQTFSKSVKFFHVQTDRNVPFLINFCSISILSKSLDTLMIDGCHHNKRAWLMCVSKTKGLDWWVFIITKGLDWCVSVKQKDFVDACQILTWHFDRSWHLSLIYPWHWFWRLLVVDYGLFYVNRGSIFYMKTKIGLQRATSILCLCPSTKYMVMRFTWHTSSTLNMGCDRHIGYQKIRPHNFSPLSTWG